jgi:hypothetical protein
MPSRTGLQALLRERSAEGPAHALIPEDDILVQDSLNLPLVAPSEY